MGRTLLKGGRVIDPVNDIDEKLDLLVDGEKIAEVGKNIEVGEAEVIDCSGLLVCPGFIDSHVHLREPGQEESETIETGTAAAVAGGFTGVACMPNTSPPIDSASVVEFVLEVAERSASCKVFPIGALSKGREGKELADIGEMVEAGAVAITDDGDYVNDSKLMRRAMEYASTFGVTVIQHAEDPYLTRGGAANEGHLSATIGLKPLPAAAEVIAIYRDIVLAEYLNLPVHIAHISTLGGVRAVREAKARGVKVTTEVCTHHFTLTEAAVKDFDTNAKMSPPLRTREDVEAIIEGIKDGTIDIICTDHAPHHKDKKDCEFDLAAFGIVGLESAIGLTITHLVKEGHIDVRRMVDAMSVQPARLFNLKGLGELTSGTPADITLIDPDRTWTFHLGATKSKSKNSPFDGAQLTGAPAGVLVEGVPLLPERE